MERAVAWARRAGPIAAALVLAACAPSSPAPSAPGDVSSEPSAAAASEIPTSGASAAPSTGPSADGSSTAGAWERLEPAPFARLEMAVAAHDGRIWLVGGLSALGAALTDVDVFDPASGTWTEGPSLPTGLHHTALVSDGERLMIVGGYLGSSFSEPTELVLVLSGDEWVPGPALPEPLAAGAAAWDGERVVYAGGVRRDGSFSVGVLVLEGDAWRQVDTMVGPREHLAAASDGEGRTWIMGGRLGGLDSNVATVEILEGEEVALGASIPTPRGGVAAFHAPGIGACLTGGETPQLALVEVECVSVDGTLTTLPDLLEPHHGHGAAVVDGVAYVMLGGPEPTLSAGSTIEALDLADVTP